MTQGGHSTLFTLLQYLTYLHAKYYTVIKNYNFTGCPDKTTDYNPVQLKSFRIKCALSSLRAHFYVISFTTNDLSIISTTFNAVERSLMHEDYQA